MISKAEKTKQYIIEKVAPIFNSKGYVDTSLSDVTQITGLTKGSVYGNFKDKEELALEAFNYNLRKVIHPLSDKIRNESNAGHKLNAITNYYRKYYNKTIAFGGCPILNVGIDANHINIPLKVRVRQVIQKLIRSIQEIIEQGQSEGTFKKEVSSILFAKRIYSMIEGSVFTAMMQNDEEHIREMMDYLDEMIENNLKI